MESRSSSPSTRNSEKVKEPAPTASRSQKQQRQEGHPPTAPQPEKLVRRQSISGEGPRSQQRRPSTSNAVQRRPSICNVGCLQRGPSNVGDPHIPTCLDRRASFEERAPLGPTFGRSLVMLSPKCNRSTQPTPSPTLAATSSNVPLVDPESLRAVLEDKVCLQLLAQTRRLHFTSAHVCSAPGTSLRSRERGRPTLRCHRGWRRLLICVTSWRRWSPGSPNWNQGAPESRRLGRCRALPRATRRSRTGN